MIEKDKNQNDIIDQELINSFEIDYIFKNKPLKKACGDSPDGCEICGGDQEKCETNI